MKGGAEEEVKQMEQKEGKKKKKKKAPDIQDLYKKKEIRARRAARQKWKAYSHTEQSVEWSPQYGKWVVIIKDIYKTDVLKEAQGQAAKRPKKKRTKNDKMKGPGRKTLKKKRRKNDKMQAKQKNEKENEEEMTATVIGVQTRASGMLSYIS